MPSHLASTRLLRSCLLALATVLLAGHPAFAQAPSVSSLEPQAVRPGETVDVQVRGSNLSGATALWTSFPAEAVLPPDVEGNGENAGQVTFRVSVPANVPAGVQAVRVVTPQGVSAMRLCVVDDLPSVARQGGNDSLAKAQVVEPPVAIDGNVDALKVSYFRFEAQAGQRMSFEVLARRLGSPLDPTIRLLDADGRELAYSDDAPALSGDARLRHTFDEAGEYVLELRDIRYQGGGAHRYRLRIGDFPCVNVPYPLAVPRDGKAKLSFAGSYVDDVQPVDVQAPEDGAWQNVGARRRENGPSGFAVTAVSDAPQALEQEPNDELKQATRVEPGHDLNGRFQKDGDVDHFVFTAKKGQQTRFTAVTRRQGSPVDLVLRLLDAKGKQLAQADDSGSLDPTITQTFPADGDYVLVAEDLLRRGGPSLAYRIAVEEPRPQLALSATADHVNVPAGGTGIVTVNVDRSSHEGAVDVTAVGLPEGVTCSGITIGAGQPSGVLTLQATESAQQATVFPLKIVGTATIGKTDVRARADAFTALKAANANMPYPPLVLEHALALAVTPAAPFSLQLASNEVAFGRDLTGKLKVVAKRSPGFDGQIALAVEPAKGGLPGNVKAALKPIPEGESEIEVSFSGTNKAPLGRFSTVLEATLKNGKQTITQYTPAIALRLAPPFTLKVDTAGGKLQPGGKLEAKVTIDRNPAFTVPVELSVANLPAGVTAEKAAIPAGKSEATLVLTAKADAKPAQAKNVTVTGTGTIGKTKHSAKSGNLTIAVTR